MPAITVKNIPPDLYEKLKLAAKANRRSINNEIIVCIEQALQIREIDPYEIIASAKLLRERTAAHQIIDEEFNQAKTEGGRGS